MTKIKRRATRLREKVLTYNLVNACKLARQGSRPFPKYKDLSVSHSPKYSWDENIPLPINKEFSTPFATNMESLNLSTMSINSRISTESVIEQRLLHNPERFVAMCKRVIQMTLVNIPQSFSTESVESLCLLEERLLKMFGKLDGYRNVLEDHLSEVEVDENLAPTLQSLYNDLVESIRVCQTASATAKEQLSLLQGMQRDCGIVSSTPLVSSDGPRRSKLNFTEEPGLGYNGSKPKNPKSDLADIIPIPTVDVDTHGSQPNRIGEGVHQISEPVATDLPLDRVISASLSEPTPALMTGTGLTSLNVSTAAHPSVASSLVRTKPFVFGSIGSSIVTSCMQGPLTVTGVSVIGATGVTASSGEAWSLPPWPNGQNSEASGLTDPLRSVPTFISVASSQKSGCITTAPQLTCSVGPVVASSGEAWSVPPWPNGQNPESMRLADSSCSIPTWMSTVPQLTRADGPMVPFSRTDSSAIATITANSQHYNPLSSMPQLGPIMSLSESGLATIGANSQGFPPNIVQLQPGSVGPSLSSPGLARAVANSQGFLPSYSQLQPGPIMSLSQPGVAMNIANPQSVGPLQSDLVAMNIASSSPDPTMSLSQPSVAMNIANPQSVGPPPTSRAYGSNGSCNDSVSSIGSITNWREFSFLPSRFLEKTIFDGMKSIARIIDVKISQDMADAQLESLDNKEARDVVRLITNLSEKLLKLEDKPGNGSVTLIQNASLAIDEANTWLADLKNLIQQRELWFSNSKSLGSPLKLEVYDGWRSRLTVYEFFDTFNIITKNISEREKATHLFVNYLSNDLQALCKHVRHDFKGQVHLLTKRFGDVVRILEEKRTAIGLLNHPTKSNDGEEARYYKKVSEILNQLEQLVIDHDDRHPELSKEIYNYSATNEIVKLFPKYIREDWADTYLRVSDMDHDGGDLPGQVAFKTLIKFITSRCRKKEMIVEKLSSKVEQQKRKSVNSLADTKQDLPKGSRHNKSKPKPKSHQQDDRQPGPSGDRWIKSVCFMHSSLKKHIRDCQIGECPEFLNASPQARAEKAKEFGLCKTCFLYKCYKRQIDGKCLYKSQLPVLIVCQSCATKDNVDCNVLLCNKHQNDSKEVRQALCKFLAGYEEATHIKINLFNVAKTVARVDVAEVQDGVVYDVSNGEVFDEKEVLHNVVKDDKEDSLYLLQQWVINGHTATVLYDTGASVSAVQGKFAIETGLQEIVSTPQSICVAGGAVHNTGFGIYSAKIGPTEDKSWHRVDFLGMKTVAPKVPRLDLASLVDECKRDLCNSPIAKEVFPSAVGGDEIKIILGISETALMPKHIADLSNGMQLYRAPLRDMWGSNLILAGPHALVTESNKRINAFNSLRIFLTDSHRLWKNYEMKDHFYFGEQPKRSELPNTIEIADGFMPLFATAVECPPTITSCSNLKLPDCSCSDDPVTEAISFCKCCFKPGSNLSNPVEVESLVSTGFINQSDHSNSPASSETCNINALFPLAGSVVQSQAVLDPLYPTSSAVSPCSYLNDDTHKFDHSSCRPNSTFLEPNSIFCQQNSASRNSEGFSSAHSGADPPSTAQIGSISSASANHNDCNINAMFCSDSSKVVCKANRRPRQLEEQLREMEDIGSRITYRCVKCAGCEVCKKSDKTREQSIQDVLQEELIEKSFDIDEEKGVTYARFPWKKDPVKYLKQLWGRDDNLHSALKVFNQQRRKSPEIRAATVKFHQELVGKGFVVPLRSLPKSVQEDIWKAPLRHYLLWRTVFKPSSTSTPCRIVVDPSMSGLNDCLCKGVNCLNSLYMIGINWRSNPVGFTSDIAKMYNSIKLYQSEYPFMLYLWSESLDPDENPEVFLYVTVTYGLVSSGNVTTAALRRIATIHKDEFPVAYETLVRWTYMDDISGSCTTVTDAKKTLAQVEQVVNKAGFNLKVSCVSGEDPPEKASSDGVSSPFAGYKWSTKADLVSIGFTEVNFNAKRRGAKAPNVEEVDTSEKVGKLVDANPLTRRMVLSKVMELYDTQGILEPIKAKLKLDMKKLTSFDYDEKLPPEYQIQWKANIILIHNAQFIAFPRSFVPHNSHSGTLTIIATCDAASAMCGTAIYARTQLPDESCHVQLVTARSKSVDATIPRNELTGLVLCAETLFCVLKTLGSRVASYFLLTDSAIALAWVKNEERPLKPYVFNRVVQIRRLVNIDNVYHIPGELNPSDILTKERDITVEDLAPESVWQKGMPWMYKNSAEWPMQTYESVCGKLTDDYDKEFIHVPGTPPACVGTWDWTIACCSLPDALLSCHCEISFGCCYCMTERLRTHVSVIQLQSKATGASKTMTDCELISHLYEDIEIGLPDCDIHEQYSDIHVTFTSPGIFMSMGTVKNSETIAYPVDPIFHGFAKCLRITAYVMRFFTRAKHASHLRHSQFVVNCHLCKLQSSESSFPDVLQSCISPALARGASLSPYDSYLAFKGLCKIATREVLSSTTASQRLEFVEGDDGILYAAGRIPQTVSLSPENPLKKSFQLAKPVALSTSPLVYSLLVQLHWDLNHPGVEKLVNIATQILHIQNVRKFCKAIRKACIRCRFILKRTLRVEVGKQNEICLSSAPIFFACQLDLATGFKAYGVNSRVTKAAHMLILVCMVTGAINIIVIESTDTEAVIGAIETHAARYGLPKFLFPDLQSSFSKLEELRVEFSNLKGCLMRDQKIQLDFATANNHAEHGKVESRVRLVKEWLHKAAENGFRHSFLQWSTICARVTNFLNSLPIARGEDCRDPNSLEMLSLITPNMFIHGFNNDRQIEGSCQLVSTKTKMLDMVNETRVFLEETLMDHLHRFIPSQSSHRKYDPPSIGDIVVFVMKSNFRARNITWKFGKVIKTFVDGRKGKVRILYKNADEAVFREIERHVSDVVLLQSLHDLDLNTREHYASLSHFSFLG